MTYLRKCILITGLAAMVVFSGVTSTWATQTHGEPEGLYVHQAAHLFFIFVMGLLIFWLRHRKLVREKAWRYIQYSAILLILWNIDTFAVHTMDELVDLIQPRRLDIWHLQIDTAEGFSFLGLVYYLAKLDHLLCVPALLYLYLGLKRLHHKLPSPTEGAPTS